MSPHSSSKSSRTLHRPVFDPDLATYGKPTNPESQDLVGFVQERLKELKLDSPKTILQTLARSRNMYRIYKVPITRSSKVSSTPSSPSSSKSSYKSSSLSTNLSFTKQSFRYSNDIFYTYVSKKKDFTFWFQRSK